MRTDVFRTAVVACCAVISVVLSVPLAQAAPDTILVYELSGFSFLPGDRFELQENGAHATFLDTLDLAFENDQFRVTAIVDNDLATSLPWGFGLFRPGYDPAADPFTDNHPAWISFHPFFAPPVSGQVYSAYVPPQPVPEPNSTVGLLAGLLALILGRARARADTSLTSDSRG